MNLYLWNLYLWNGNVYVPTEARTEAGYFMDIDPVAVVSITDTDALRGTIKEAMDKGNPIIPTPTRAAFPKPVVLKYAKVKSWSAFEKGALNWTIVEKSGIYQIKPGRKRPDRGWEEDQAKIESFAFGTGVPSVIDRVASLIQAAANGTDDNQ
jgi:hypothetical protein